MAGLLPAKAEPGSARLDTPRTIEPRRDPWLPAVRAAVEGLATTSTPAVLRAIGQKKSKGNSQLIRIARLLRCLGWVRGKRCRTPGGMAWIWVQDEASCQPVHAS
jgi:hypothetical protein